MVIPVAVDGDDHILGKELGSHFEEEIQNIDPVEEGGVVCCRETGNEPREFPENPLHLVIGHQEGRKGN